MRARAEFLWRAVAICFVLSWCRLELSELGVTDDVMVQSAHPREADGRLREAGVR